MNKPTFETDANDGSCSWWMTGYNIDNGSFYF